MNITLFVTLGLLTAFGPFVTDFYLPALPALADYFRSSASMAQMSLTTGMLGLAVGQVFIGPISDRYGRRIPLLVSMAAFIAATTFCIVAPNIYLFNLLRLLQGFTAAGGIVLARSIATDLYTGSELTRFIAMISAVNGIAPVVAPVGGGLSPLAFGFCFAANAVGIGVGCAVAGRFTDPYRGLRIGGSVCVVAAIVTSAVL